MRVLVIGGGVIGLTTALALLEAGWEVTVMAEEWAPKIVSSVAAAIWHPYQVSHSEATRWAMVSAERFRRLRHQTASGVGVVKGWDLHRRMVPPPDWAIRMDSFRELDSDELPVGYTSGYSIQLPLIETPIYMRWLMDAIEERGGRLVQRKLQSLEEVTGEWKFIAHCSGLGARGLAGDESVVPIRGQIVKLEPGLVTEFFFDEDDAEAPTYVIPRRDGTIVGGTALYGDWETEVRVETTKALLERAARLVPGIRASRILDVLVGLRPGRPTVRVEAETLDGAVVVHNYGHGGAGFTLSWGCAEEVRTLLQEGVPGLSRE